MWQLHFPQNKGKQEQAVDPSTPVNVSYSYSFGSDRLQKMQNILWENVWKSIRNYM